MLFQNMGALVEPDKLVAISEQISTFIVSFAETGFSVEDLADDISDFRVYLEALVGNVSSRSAKQAQDFLQNPRCTLLTSLLDETRKAMR